MLMTNAMGLIGPHEGFKQSVMDCKNIVQVSFNQNQLLPAA